MYTFEVTFEGELVGHYEADNEEQARMDAMDDTDIPAYELKALMI